MDIGAALAVTYCHLRNNPVHTATLSVKEQPRLHHLLQLGFILAVISNIRL